jgi:acetyltransferase-like isoleucine patch superfamily enzyme
MSSKSDHTQQIESLRAKCVGHGGRIAESARVSPTVELEGAVDIADDAVIYGAVRIGSFSYISVGAVAYPNVTLGRFCSISRNVQLGLARHPVHFLSSHPFQFSQGLFSGVPGYNSLQTAKWRVHRPTVVGHDVWIGANAMVLSGVEIGTGAVIGAGAVITGDVEPYDIMGGVPARKIGRRFDESTVDQLLGSRWWELPLSELATVPFDDIVNALIKLHAIRVRNGRQ